jgi:hypothetical protein
MEATFRCSLSYKSSRPSVELELLCDFYTVVHGSEEELSYTQLKKYAARQDIDHKGAGRDEQQDATARRMVTTRPTKSKNTFFFNVLSSDKIINEKIKRRVNHLGFQKIAEQQDE